MDYLYFVLAAVFLFAGIVKLIGPESLKKQYKHWNMPAGSRYMIAVLEIVTAALLFFPETEFTSLLAACFIMTGAVLALIIASAYVRTLIPLAIFGLAAYLLLMNYPDTLMMKIGLGVNAVLLLLGTFLWAVPATTKNKDGDIEFLDETTSVTHHFQQALGINYHFVTAGNPKNHPVVLIPGLPETWFAWAHQIIALSKNYYVIAIDMKPFGQTDKDLDGDHSYEQISAEVKALLDGIGINQFSLMGHDRGSVTCDHLLTKEGMSKRVTKYIRMQQSFNEPHGIPVPPHHIMGTYLGTMAYKMRFMIPLMYNSDYVKVKLNKKDVRRIDKEFRFANTAQAICLTFKTTNFDKELKDRQHWIFSHMTMPILILQGVHDPGQHKEEYYESHKVCPDLRVEFIDAGHFFLGEVPEISNKHILNFLSEKRKEKAPVQEVEEQNA